MGPDDRAWHGRRRPDMRVAFVVLLTGACLVAVAVYRWTLGTAFDWFFLGVFLLFLFIYVFLVLATAYEVTVALAGDELQVTVVEYLAGRRMQERVEAVPRWRMAKIRERRVGELVHNTKVEDAGGRTLVAFPRFLSLEEHDAMVEAIIGWGNQPPAPSSPSSSASGDGDGSREADAR
jgi:hypothetical protein